MEKMKKRWQALYDYRFLIKQLVSRDFKTKYKRKRGYIVKLRDIS